MTDERHERRHTEPPPELRERAERQVEPPSKGDPDRELGPDEARRLVHELRVHQAELEMQNQQLVETKQQLERSRDRYRDLFDLAPIGYLGLDDDGRIVDASWVASSMLGLPRGELSGRPLSHVVDPDDTDRVHRHLQQVRATGRRSTCEASITESLGGSLIVRIETAAVTAGPGDDYRYRTALIDVTDRKRTEAALREREGRVRAILESAIDAIVTFDSRGRIEAVNDATSRIFGYRAEELLGEPVATLVPGVHRLPGGVHHEALGRRKDGTTLPIDLAMAEQVSGGRLVTAVIRDLTQHKRAERQLRQAQKMDAIGRLASGIAHDFNNVLMGVLACADMGLYKLGEDDPARRYLEEIRRAAAGGASVVSQLMAFSRDEDAALESVALDDVARRTEGLLTPLLGEDVRLAMSLEADDGWIRAARGQIEQILVNLAVNARDAMPQGGTLRISTRSEEVQPGQAGRELGVDEGRWLVITVSDTGHGMDEQTRANAFEPFFTTKGPEYGTGLGLSTIYGIVEQLGGAIDVRSELDAGTTFRIHLPRAEAPAAVQPAEWEVGPRGGGETVLVVEDEPHVRMGIASYLERAGYRVLEAEDVEQARAQLGREGAGVELVLADVVLPGGVSGSELAERLHRRDDPAVVLMSAHSRSMLAERAPVPAGVALLEKPFSERGLRERVREALDRDARSASRPVEARRDRGTGTILLVEDQEVARSAMRELLEERGYEVLEAHDTRHALRLGKEHGEAIDLVLTDLGLPDGRGTALVEHMRESHAELPVMYMSGNAPQDDPELATALEQPRTSFVGKPIEFEQVTDELDHLLESAS